MSDDEQSTSPIEKTTQLYWEQFAVMQHLPAGLAANTKLDVIANDTIFPGLMARLTAMILTDTFAEDTYTATIGTPATTWQMFKQTHGASWWLRWLVSRRPVRTTLHTAEVKVKRMHTYPEAQIQHQSLGPVRIYEAALAGSAVSDHLGPELAAEVARRALHPYAGHPATLRSYLHETCQHHWQRWPGDDQLEAHRQCLWCCKVEMETA